MDGGARKFLEPWTIRSFSLLLVIFFLMAGEFGEKAEAKRRLAILPFLVEHGVRPEKGALCPICGGIRRSGMIPPGSEKTLTHLLFTKMEARGTFQILCHERMDELLREFDEKTIRERPVFASIRMGKMLNADFLLIGSLFLFEERIGSALGVERPASVCFDLHLFRLRDEKMVWIGKFDETQRPLSDDLFKIGAFLRRKASWLTALELANVGMDELLMALPEISELEGRP